MACGNKRILMFLPGLLLVAGIAIAGISIGSVSIPPSEVIRHIFGNPKTTIVRYDRDAFGNVSLEGATEIRLVHEEFGEMDIALDLFENVDLDDPGISAILVFYSGKGGENPDDDTNRDIIRKIRGPRVAASLFGGAALAVAGLLMQIFFRNPIVDPYVLGISNGSTFVTALFMLAGLRFGLVAGTPLGRFFAAFIGAMVVMAIVLAFALRVRNSVALLVIGIMVGYFCSAGTGFLMTFADKEAVKGFVIYSMGSFSGFMWNEVWILGAVTLFFCGISFLMGKQLNAFLLGEDYAKSMGVNLRLFRVMTILVSGVLTAVVTAFAGPIAFIGLAVPHMVKMLFKSSDSRILVPGCMLYGAFVTAFCDLLSRRLFSPQELALSTVTSVFGVPIVIHMILKNRANARDV